MSCEHCWAEAKVRGVEYAVVLQEAEATKAPCTHNTPEGAKLRAGQFWDDVLQVDTRIAIAHTTVAQVVLQELTDRLIRTAPDFDQPKGRLPYKVTILAEYPDSNTVVEVNLEFPKNL